MTLALIIGAGALIGLSLGALGGGGSVLTVPVLVYGLGQSAAQATTASLLAFSAASERPFKKHTSCRRRDFSL